MSDCLFCKIRDGEIPSHIIYEDEHTFAFLDIGPVSEGHTLIIPKEHSENLNAATLETVQRLMETVHKIAPKVMRALGASGYNLGMNHGADAGQEVFHTHLHLMPRYPGVPRTFQKTRPSQERLAATAEKIRNEIQS